jgi:hypothetical protein
MDAAGREGVRSISLFLLALSVATGGFSVIAAEGAVSGERSLFIAAFCIAVLSSASLLFPRAFGFPCLIGIGAAIAIVGYCFLSIPPTHEDDAVGILSIGEGDSVSVRFRSADGFSEEASGRLSPPVRIELHRVTFHRLYPVWGGTKRAALSSIRFGDGSLLQSTRPTPVRSFATQDGGEESLFGALGIRIDRMTVEFVPDPVIAGMRLGIYADGNVNRLNH